MDAIIFEVDFGSVKLIFLDRREGKKGIVTVQLENFKLWDGGGAFLLATW